MFQNNKLKNKVKNIIKEVLKMESEYGIQILKDWMINDNNSYDKNIKFLNKLTEMTPEDKLFNPLNKIHLQEEMKAKKIRQLICEYA